MAVRPNPPQQAAAAAPPPGGVALAPQGAHAGKPSLPLTRAFTLIGSRNRAHLHLVSPSVSKSHAAVIATQSGLYVRDLASRAHTIVNGRPQRESDLKHGDKLAVGSFSFRVDAKGFAKPKFAPEPPKAVLAVEGADFPIPFEGRTLLIGRRPTCDVPLVEESVSTVHALIFEADGSHFVRDLGSRTGTLVNGKPVHQHPLSFGDELRVGDTVMRYVAEAGAAEHFEEDLAGTARLSDAHEDPVPAPRGFAPPPVPPPAARVVQPAAPASEADDLDLLPLADEAEAAPVGNWDRVRTPAPVRPAEPEPAAAAPHAADDAIPLETDEVPPEQTLAAAADDDGAPLDEIPAEDLIDFDLPAEALELDAAPAAELPLEAPAEAEAAEAFDDLELAPEAGPSAPAVADAAAEDEVPAAAEQDEPVAAEAADGFDDLGLEFGEPAEPEPAKAAAAEELGELDLSGLTLEPVAADAEEPRPTDDDLGLELDAPLVGAADDDAAPLLDLGVAPVVAEAPAAPAEDEAPAPGPKKSRKKPAAKKDKPAAAPKKDSSKKDKQSWWGRKRKQQQGEPKAPEAAPDEPLAPLAPAAAAAAAGAAALAPGDESITGDDLAFLDDILGAETTAAVAADAPALGDEPLAATDDAAPVVAADATIDLADADETSAIDFAPPEPVDSLAGLDFSNLATGSGLDLGGVVDTVELPQTADAGAESVLPPAAPELVESEAADADVQEAELDFAPADAERRSPDEDLVPAAETPEPSAEQAPLVALDPTADDDAEAATPVAAGSVDAGSDSLDLATESLGFADEGVAPAAAEADAAEVLEVTEPTPESALDLELADVTDAATEIAAPVDASADLSDTTFGRAVESMGDPALEPVVEAEADAPAAAPAADAESDELVPAEPEPAADDAAAARASAPAGEDDEALDDAFVLASAEESADQDVAASAPAAQSAAPDLAFDELLDDVLGGDTAESEPALRFNLDDVPPAAPYTPPAAAAEADDAAELSFDAPAAAEGDEWTDAAATVVDAGAEDDNEAELVVGDAFAGDESDEAAANEPVQTAAALEDAAASDELSDDTLAVADPEPGSEGEPAAFAERAAAADDDALALDEPPLMTDLTSATEDEAAPVAPSDPAGLSEGEAAEALEFDLDPTADAPQFAAATGPADADEAIDLDVLSPEDRAELTGAVDAAALETVDDVAPPAPEVEAEAEAVAEVPKVDAPAIRPFDPFMGMGLDLGSFIGGMPLQLAPVAGVGAGPVGIDRAPEPAAAEPEPEAAAAAGEGAVEDELSLPADEFELPLPAGDVDADIEAIDFTSEPAEDEPVAPAAEAPPAVEAAPVAPVPAAPAKGRSVPKPPPPAKNIPPRHAPPAGRAVAHSPFDIGLGDAADGSVEIPPFDRAGPKAGPLTTAFDGLALDDEDQADVFSGLGAAADPIFGLPSRPAAAAPPARPAQGSPPEGRDVNAGAAANDDDDDDDLDGGTPAGEEEVAPVAAGAEPPAPEPRPAGKVPAAARPPAGRRSPGYTPPPVVEPVNPNPPPPAKKRRWGVRFLLPVMLLCAGLAVAAVYLLQPRFFPRTVEVSGYLEFDGLEKLGEGDRRAELARQRELLKAMQSMAREMLIGIDDRLAPGFLGMESERDQLAFATVADSAKFQDRTNKLALFHRGNDAQGDPKRMAALLRALHTKNAGLADDVLAKKSEYAKLDADVSRILRDQAELKARLDVGRNRDESYVAGLDSKVNELKGNDDRLVTDLQKARLLVKDMEAELDRAVAANAGPGGAAADKRGAQAAGGGPTDPADDPQLKEMGQRLAELTASLSRAKGAKTAESAAAAKQLNDALSQFDKQIAAAQSELKGDDQLVRYVTAAQATQRRISSLYEGFVAQQHDWTEKLSKQKSRLAEKLEARIKEAWADDPGLKSLQETLSVKEHHRNAAAASGLTDATKKLDVEIAALNAKIDAQRELVGASYASAGDVREQQEFVDELLQLINNHRATNDKAMAEAFEDFKKEVPSLEKLPAEQQRLATALAQRSAELNAAREQYLKASAGETAADTKVIETEVAQTQAKIDARKRQLADAAAQDLTAQQRQEREFKIAQGRTNLDNAKAALDRAESAYWANSKALVEAQTNARLAKDALVRLRNDERQLADLETQRRDKLARAEQLQKELDRKITPLAVRDDAVTWTLGDDPRPVWSMIAVFGIIGFFSLLMFATAHHPHPADDENVPFAANAYADEFAEPAPRFADIDAAALAAGVNGNGHAFAGVGEALPDDELPDGSAADDERRLAV